MIYRCRLTSEGDVTFLSLTLGFSFVFLLLTNFYCSSLLEGAGYLCLSHSWHPSVPTTSQATSQPQTTTINQPFLHLFFKPQHVMVTVPHKRAPTVALDWDYAVVGQALAFADTVQELPD
jgi:hypothetical protein